jgi:hypothetical protein
MLQGALTEASATASNTRSNTGDNTGAKQMNKHSIKSTDCEKRLKCVE